MKPLIVTVDDNRPLLNGDRFDIHSETLSGKTAYYVGSGLTVESVLEAYVIENDTAYFSKSGLSKSYTYNTYDGGKFRVYPISVWGSADTEGEASELIERLFEAAQSEGISFADTAANIAGRICRANVETKQLQPRWRELAHSAINQGPMCVVKAGAEYAIALDREKAFLRALYEPVPSGVWVACNPSSWPYLSEHSGIVSATVYVSPERYKLHIPCLPVKYSGFTVYPTGLVRGVWTTGMLRDALEHGGYSIVNIHELMVCKTDKLHAKAADKISSIKDKDLKKLIYTRYWGRLASVGGFNGFRDMRYPYVKHKRIIGSKLYWYYVGKSPTSSCSPDYRPDHAAFISSANHLVMNQALRLYKPGEVIATHVDCIWTTDTKTKPYDSFREKHKGKARFYGVGCYNVGGNLAAQGFKGEMTEDAVAQWGASLSSGDKVYRDWTGNPAVDEKAYSNPVEHTERHILSNPPVRNIPDIYSVEWNTKGWPKQEKINV